MPYDPVTPDQFKTAKPQFADVPDDEIQIYLDLAGRFVDDSWTAGDYAPAIIAMACHLMTLEGLGTSGEAEIAAAGGARLTSLKSGTLSITLASSNQTGDEFMDWLGESACGRFYRTLLMMNKRGPRLLGGGCQISSGYAKDWPYKFPGVGRD